MLGKKVRLALLSFAVFVLQGCVTSDPRCVTSEPKAAAAPDEHGLFLRTPEPKGNFRRFKRSLNTTSYGYRVVAAPHPVRAGGWSERFEVRPGDCGVGPSWSDCDNDRERSELSESKPRSNVGEEYWYGWSIYVPKDYPNIWPTKTALGQFHQVAAKAPPVMFQNFEGGYWLDFNQLELIRKQLIPEKEFRGRWHDIVVHVKWCCPRKVWTKNVDGFFKVWVNGKLKIDFKGAVTRYYRQIYFKYGVYRSFISRYKNKCNTDKVPTQIVYYDEVRKGNSREDVDPGLWAISLSASAGEAGRLADEKSAVHDGNWAGRALLGHVLGDGRCSRNFTFELGISGSKVVGRSSTGTYGYTIKGNSSLVRLNVAVGSITASGDLKVGGGVNDIRLIGSLSPEAGTGSGHWSFRGCAGTFKLSREKKPE